MSMDPNNPYAPVGGAGVVPVDGKFPPDVEKKIEAVIKDARQFWLAILLCFLCSGIGFLIIGPWYLVRLVQWNSLNSQFPGLQDPNALPGSIERRFQSSFWKLIVGLVAGVLLFMSVFFFVVLTAATATPRP
ncbi:MAG: hypothetical protein AAFX06_14600 [Planctomycetota bacterium]